MTKIKNIPGGTTFYDINGNKYIKLNMTYDVLQKHCCDSPTKSVVNCLLVIQGILMYLDEEIWVETAQELSSGA